MRACVSSFLTRVGACEAVSFFCILTRIKTFSVMEKYTMGATASWLEECFPCQQEKPNLFLAEISRCVGVFSLNKEQFHEACLFLQSLQFGYQKFFSTVALELKILFIALVLDRSSALGFSGLFCIC